VKLLAVDTALGACSAALLDRDTVLAHRFEPMDRGHAERLAPMVQEVMAEANLAFAALDRLAVTTGPGTFTGQRVGLAFARGLRVALNKPLIGITTLSAMAAQAMAQTGCKTAAAIHDARRGEVYLEIAGQHTAPPEVLIFNDAIHRLESLRDDFALAGTAAPATLVAFPHAQMSSVQQPDAIWVARLAARAPAIDTAPKPLYLRAPDAKLPAPR
jgi:tRNA threonylcarbamoyladenosine biosynthesis protein TsaB